MTPTQAQAPIVALELTVADHIQNGFVHLAVWHYPTEQDARAAMAEIEALFSDEAAGNPKEDDFTFTLDLHDDYPDNHIDETRCLPLQLAMRIAPDAVRRWLAERPDPDAVSHRWPPILDALLAEGGAA